MSRLKDQLPCEVVAVDFNPDIPLHEAKVVRPVWMCSAGTLPKMQSYGLERSHLPPNIFFSPTRALSTGSFCGTVALLGCQVFCDGRVGWHHLHCGWAFVWHSFGALSFTKHRQFYFESYPKLLVVAALSSFYFSVYFVIGCWILFICQLLVSAQGHFWLMP